MGRNGQQHTNTTTSVYYSYIVRVIVLHQEEGTHVRAILHTRGLQGCDVCAVVYTRSKLTLTNGARRVTKSATEYHNVVRQSQYQSRRRTTLLHPPPPLISQNSGDDPTGCFL